MKEEFERVWSQFEPLTEGEQLKAVCELFYMKGHCDGKESVLSEIRPLVHKMSPQESAKVESETIGETINYRHLGDVIEAKKHVS